MTLGNVLDVLNVGTKSFDVEVLLELYHYYDFFKAVVGTDYGVCLVEEQVDRRVEGKAINYDRIVSCIFEVFGAASRHYD